jgi:outer membrane protein assembly factor BamA
MVNLNVELRIPAKKSLGFALFQDMGALSNTKFADVKMRHILAGTGAGIRIQTPIGPLRFDFAFKWHRPDQATAPYCWFLSFGNAF